MTINVSVRVDGAQNVRSNLRDIRLKVPREVLGPSLRKGAERVAASARQTRSFENRTWRLRRSIRVEQSRSSGGRFQFGWQVLAGGGAVFYARFIELGTRYIRARRFLLNAWKRQRTNVLRIIQQDAREYFARRPR